MENLIWDAVPAQRTRKEEKYNFAVVTMSAIEKLGAGRKFSFNKAAQELLGVKGKDRVSFGFTPDGAHIYIRKASGTNGFELTQACTISDKKTFEFIVKRLSLDTSVENEFNVNTTDLGEGIFELVTLKEMLKMQDIPAMPEITKFELGEISDEEDDSADLSSIPETPEGGTEYVEEAEEMSDASMEADEEVEDTDNDIMGVTFDDVEEVAEVEDTEEDVW